MDAFLGKARDGDKAGMLKAFKDAADKLGKASNQSLPSGWTRLVEAPTVSVQTVIEPEDDDADDAKLKSINNCIKTLFKATEGGEAPPASFYDTPELRQMIYDWQRSYIHNKSFQRIDSTRQFDSDVKRIEYRNCKITWAKGFGNDEGELI